MIVDELYLTIDIIGGFVTIFYLAHSITAWLLIFSSQSLMMYCDITPTWWECCHCWNRTGPLSLYLKREKSCCSFLFYEIQYVVQGHKHLKA